jgi:hypothetical protein
VTRRGRASEVRAVEARGEQRAEAWRRGLEIFPGWDAYQSRAGGRRIAVFVLQPARA